MLKLLYIDACPRGEGVSRSLMLGDAFVDAFARAYPKAEVIRCRLPEMDLRPVDGAMLARREALIDQRAWQDDLFAPARDFADADAIAVAAPYWDLMFPAMLKVYIEHIFIRELTFRYRDDAPMGLCRARRAAFMTTSGSPMGEADFGVTYLRATFDMLGVKRFDTVTAEGLDLLGADAAALLAAAQARARALAASFV